MKRNDPYMERVKTQEDPIVRRAQLQMLGAARELLAAKDRLRDAKRELERHPDYIRTDRARRKDKAVGASLTLAWFVHNSILSALHDASVEEAADWLFEDSNPRRAASALRLFVDTERRDLARFARRRPARQKAPALVLVPQAA